MRRPFFSVIVPTYNRARLLPRALNSLLKQAEPDWEAIVVDDGSTDRTGELIRSYHIEDSRIRYYRHSHRGVSRSCTEGVKFSRGRYVTFLGSDDEYKPNHLQTRKALLRSHPEIELLHGGVKIIGSAYVPDARQPTKRIHIKFCVLSGTFFLRPATYLRFGGFGAYRFAGEFYFFKRLQAANVKIKKTRRQTYIYHREHSTSLTHAAHLTSSRRSRKPILIAR